MDSRPPTVDENPPLQTVLTSLTDEDSRRILESLNDPLSAREIAEVCDIPLSTTYRKLNVLSEASLVSERIDVSEPGKHTTRYKADFEKVTVKLNEDGEFQVDVATEIAGRDSVLSTRWQEITH
ncbi:Transcriptional regulator containing HTH domain,ArsR family [Halanaeroarchaeum sp. HSR-CO]|uniref:winged helix-turn-helix domain-containing protein n=1 Tax=Halanaeroarchaeum sp. HSR-CO TaxID=2866382 RepID=UPI00217DE947|nr:helix-turn-helix domain-containing protein [Halanaeroarchaeum sp. HSR-CO]UWG47709.1 Transcriptional regulator containing HTH domain,ArsR family [Halanaeroarchaeum sp. HSR-CO]